MAIDVKKTLDKILGKVEVKELLWTNPNLTVEFPAQTISLDLNDYSYVEIKYLERLQQANSISYKKIAVGEATHIWGMFTTIYENMKYLDVRTASVSSSGIAFSDGKYGKTAQDTLDTSNSAIVPVKIYGIK